MGNAVNKDDLNKQIEYFKKNTYEQKSLKHNDLVKLHKRVIQEYPFITNIYQSVLVTDFKLKDNPIVFANDAFVEMTGYLKEEIVGKNCRFLQGELTDRTTVARIRRAVQSGQSLDVEILNYRKNGTMFWNIFQMLPIHNKKGDVTHFIALQKDMTIVKTIGPDPIHWTNLEVAMWFKHIECSDYAKIAISEAITGEVLFDLNEEDLKGLKISNEDIPKILQQIQKLKEEFTEKLSRQSNVDIQNDSQRKKFFEESKKGKKRAQDWTPEEVTYFLDSIQLSSYSPEFLRAKINGSKLLQFNNIDLLELGITSATKRAILLTEISKMAFNVILVKYTLDSQVYSFRVDAGMSIIDVRNQIALKHPEFMNNIPSFQIVFEEN